MSLWARVEEKLLAVGQELGVQAGTCPRTDCGEHLLAVPGAMGLPPGVPEVCEVSGDALEIPPEER